MKLSVIIPTFNEANRLPKTLTDVKNYLLKNFDESEIIISDGGSNDGTREFIHGVLNPTGKLKIKAVYDKNREGKGAGVKKGMLAASGEWVLFMDADNSTRIQEIEKFWLYKNDFQVVIGSRYLGLQAQVKQSILRRFVSRAGSRVIRLIMGLNIKDTQCGFKLFRKDASKDIFGCLQTKGWGFDVEALLLAKQLGYKIKEVPVVWADAEGSHLRAGKDSFKTLFEVIHILRIINSNGKKR